MQLEDARAAYEEAENLVKQLKAALKEKRQVIAAAEKDLAPSIDQADQVAAEVPLPTQLRTLLVHPAIFPCPRLYFEDTCNAKQFQCKDAGSFWCTRQDLLLQAIR